jgi:hypothetical protein
MTELDAVNEMLLAIGQAPVNTLEVAGIRDVSVARLQLTNVNRELQVAGHKFNTHVVTLSRRIDGHILIPSDALQVDPVDPAVDAIMQVDVNDGGARKLFDVRNETYVWEKPVQVEVIRLLSFEALPQYARNYITAVAARRFQASVVGSDQLDRQLEKREAAAYAALRKAELLAQDNNIIRDAAIRHGRSLTYNRYRNSRYA